MGIIGKLRTRHLQLLLITVCITSAAAVKYSFTVAIIAMTDSKNGEKSTTSHPPNVSFGAERSERNWNSREISLVLSSFNWGMAVLLIPSGYLVNLCSPKRLFASSMLFSGTANLFMPLLVTLTEWKGACAGRMALGMGEAFMDVCAYTLLSKWAPPRELSRMCAIMGSGHILGAIISNSLSGFIASSSIGWPGIFYVFGLGVIISTVLMAVYVVDSPQVHSTISLEEKTFIAKSFCEVKNYTEFKPKKVPWIKILTSLPVWSIIVAQLGFNWYVTMCNYEYPIYMKHVMKFKTVKVGLINTASFIALCLMMYIFGWTSDYAFRRGLSVSILRRLFNTLALWTMALGALGLSFTGPEHELLTVALYILMTGIASGVYCGFLVNQIDLSPNFAGTIQSIVTFVGMFTWIVAPIVCGAIVTDLTNEHQWNNVNHVTASILFFSNAIFIICGRAEIQPWDGINDHTHNVNNEEWNKMSEIPTII